MALISKDNRDWASAITKIKYKEGTKFQTGDIAIREDGCRMIYIDEKTYLKCKDIIGSFFSSIEYVDIKDGFFICVYKGLSFSYLTMQDFYNNLDRFTIDVIYRNLINDLKKFLKDPDLAKTTVYELTKDWSM